MDTYGIPVTKCSACGTAFDAATLVGKGTPPKPGDVSVCLYCSHVMIFRKNMTLRDLREPEKEAVEKDERVKKIRAAQAELWKKERH